MEDTSIRRCQNKKTFWSAPHWKRFIRKLAKTQSFKKMFASNLILKSTLSNQPYVNESAIR